MLKIFIFRLILPSTTSPSSASLARFINFTRIFIGISVAFKSNVFVLLVWPVVLFWFFVTKNILIFCPATQRYQLW